MKNDRTILLVVVIFLICIGIVMIYSSSSIYAYEHKNDSAFFLKKHLLYIFFSIIAFFLTLVFPYKRLNFYLPILLIFIYLLLILVLLPGIGVQIGGAQRWLSLGFIRFQPTEIAKLVLIIYLANFISRKQMLFDSFLKGFLLPVLVGFSMSSLVLLQPDLGNAVFLIVITLFILLVAGARIKYFLSVCIASIPFVLFFIFSVPYRRNRIIAFLHPWSNIKDIGFQLVQSYLAFGSGGLFGVGLGKSRQKLFYLPASHTDFIFSIIGEEIGFIGTSLVLILFFLLMFIGFKIIFSKTDKFAKMLALGIVVSIILQAVLNMAVTTGLVPTKGLPLPFVSYGGTNLIMNVIQIGLLLNISKNAP